MSEDRAEITALHLVAQNNFLEMIPILVAAGGDLNAETEEDETPLIIAKFHKHKKMIVLLEKLHNKS